MVQTQSETHTGQEAPTTAPDTDLAITPSSETSQELPSQETQGPTMSSLKINSRCPNGP
ncbi:hypothetical protein NDU88_007539, partial [Pleurodeles waltl]